MKSSLYRTIEHHFPIIESRIIPEGSAVYYDNMIYVNNLYKYIFSLLDFDEALDFACQYAKGLINDRVDAYFKPITIDLKCISDFDLNEFVKQWRSETGLIFYKASDEHRIRPVTII